MDESGKSNDRRDREDVEGTKNRQQQRKRKNVTATPRPRKKSANRRSRSGERREEKLHEDKNEYE